MYSYTLFSENGRTYNTTYGCRERLIRGYNRTLSRPKSDKIVLNRNIYFGHVSNREVIPQTVIDRYLPICNTIWKGRINCELIKFKDITNNCQAKNVLHYYSGFTDIPVVKVKGLVNPLDLSLILLLSWFGNTSNLYIKRYFLTKKYSEFIPDYRRDFPTDVSYWNSFNGPESYMSFIRWNNKSLSSEIDKIYDIYKEEEIKF
jgi:hypothetical protein